MLFRSFTAVGSSDVVCAGPYTTAQLSAVPTQLRLVGCGVKVKYAGTELARAGRLILYRAQANNGITNGTISQLMSVPLTRKSSVVKEWKSVCYVPDDPDFLGYQTYAALQAANPTTSKVLMMIVAGAPPKTTFDYEVSAYWEMIGSINSNVYGNYTKSHSDINAMGSAIASLPTKISEKPPEVS